MPESTFLVEGHIYGVVNLWSRHATPVAFCHAIASAVKTQGVLYNSTTDNWSKVDAMYKRDDGSPMHQFAGVDLSNSGYCNLLIAGHILDIATGNANDGSPITSVRYGNDAVTAALSFSMIFDGVNWIQDESRYKTTAGNVKIESQKAGLVKTVKYRAQATGGTYPK